MSHTQLSRWLDPQHKGLLTFSLNNDNPLGGLGLRDPLLEY